MCEVERAVDKITECIDQLVIDPLRKDLPGEIEILRVVRVREEVVPKIIRGETSVEVILIRPDHVPA